METAATKTILLVEDEAIIALAERFVLEKNGYRVLTAGSGEDAVETAAARPGIDLILMDINLGSGMDGTEAAERILRRHDIPVIFLSSHTERDVVEKTEGITSYGYIVKNSGDTVLLASIRMAFRLFEAKTREKLGERRIRMQHSLLSGIIDSSASSIFSVDRDYRYTSFNDAHARTMREVCGRGIRIGDSVLDSGPDGGRSAGLKMNIDRALEGEQFTVQEETGGDPKNSTCLEITHNPIRGKDGRIIGVSVFSTDVTERRRAEKALGHSHDLMRYIIEHSRSAIAVHDRNLNYIYVSRRYLEDYRVAEKDVIGRHHYAVFPDLPRKWRDVHTRALAGEILSAEKDPFIRADGTAYMTRWECRPWYEADGSIGGIVVYTEVLDRTENAPLRNAAGDEREALVRILALINEKDDTREFLSGVCGCIAEWSGCEAVGVRLAEGEDFPYFEHRGFPPEFIELENSLCAFDLAGQMLRDPAGDPVLDCMCGNVIRGKFDPSLPFFTGKGSFWTGSTTRLLATTGEAERQSRTRNRCNGMGYESVALVPLRLGGETFGLLQVNDRRPGRVSREIVGTLERLCGSISVALSRRKLVRDLKESEAKFRTVADFTDDLEYLIDQNGRILHISPSCERITGYSAAEFTADPSLLVSIVHPDDKDTVMKHVKLAMTPGRGRDEESLDFRILCRDGRVAWISHRCRSVFEGAAWRGIRGSNRDVTKTKLAEKDIRALLGEKDLLLKETHHRVKNTMSVVHGLLSLQAAREENSRCGEILADAARRIQRMAALYDRLYRPGAGDLDVREFLEILVGDIIGVFPPEPEVRARVAAENITLDAKRLSSLGIIVNELVTNSMKHAFRGQRGGLITVEAVRKDGRIVFSYADDGPGLPRETAPADKMGLQIVGLLARQIGGTLTIAGENGARFVIEFPEAVSIPGPGGDPQAPGDVRR